MRHRIIVLAACGLFGCDAGTATPAKEAPPQRDAPKEPAAQVAPAAPAPADAAPAEDVAVAVADAGGSREGWTERSLKDEVPLCVFASYAERAKAEHVHQAKKQTLKANTEIVFGAFGPGCMNEACDARPTLQCWVDQEDDTLVVHSSFYAEHKDGSKCTEDCQPVIAGCPTEPLKPGKYTVRYGDKTFPLRIPSVLSKPCFKLK